MDDPVRDRLRALVVRAYEETAEEPSPIQIEGDDFLPDILDSLGFASLVTLIEEEWSMEIADEELDPEVLIDLASLSEFVKSKLGRRSSA